MTQAQYARHRGCSKVAVGKAVRAQRISLVDGLIDPAVGDIQWARNTRARVSAGDAVRVPDSGPDLLSAAPGAAGKKNPDLAPAAPDNYTAARARTELANAGLRELELARLRGDVRDVTDIRRGGFDIAREVRNALDSSVNTLAAELAEIQNADACAQVLRRHNRTIQEMLAKGLRDKLNVATAGANLN
jgi:hypothetical protein